jgi:hypothetical protein
MPLISPTPQNPLPPQGEEALLSKPTLVQSLPFTAYDVEDLSPLGTSNNPLDVPKLGTNQSTPQPKWSPSSTYLNSVEGTIASPNSSAEKNNFKTSALDLEDPLAGVNPPPGSNQGASGGPNRTNAIQSKNAFQSGQYTTTRAGGPGFGGNDVGGVVIKQTLHTYTPNNTYLDTIPIQTSANFTPKNNIAIEGEANGFDATIK